MPPWGEGAEFTLGSWTLPRSRDPGVPPVQQFILYATSPKLKAVEVRETEGEEHGAFTAALLAGLRGAGAAKAWSWERNCYEVRWERLADYVKMRIQARRARSRRRRAARCSRSRRTPAAAAWPGGPAMSR